LTAILPVACTILAVAGCTRSSWRNGDSSEQVQHQGMQAMSALRSGNYSEAASLARQAIEIDPSSVDAHLVLADACLAQGKYEEVRVAAIATVEIQVDQPSAWFMRALSEERLGLMLQAKESYEAFLRYADSRATVEGIALAESRLALLTGNEERPDPRAISRLPEGVGRASD